MLPLTTGAALLLVLVVRWSLAAVATLLAAVATATAAVGLLATPLTAAAAVALAALSATIAAATTRVAAAAIAISTAAASIVAATASEAAASAAAGVVAAIRRLVDTDGTTVEFDIIHGSNGSFRFGLLGEANEAESTAAAGIAVLDDNGFFDSSKLLKLSAEGRVICVPGETADEKLRHVCKVGQWERSRWSGKVMMISISGVLGDEDCTR